MGNCLVTKLKGVVDNDSLLKMGELRIKCSTAACGGTTTENMRGLWLRSMNVPMKITAGGRTFSYDGVDYTEYNGNGSRSGTPFIFPDGEYEISIISEIDTANNVWGLSNITTVPTAVASKFFTLNASDLKYHNILSLVTSRIICIGEIDGNFDNTNELQASWGQDGEFMEPNSNSFNLDKLSNNLVLTTLRFDDTMTYLRGSIESIKSPLLTKFTAWGGEVTGDIAVMCNNMVAAGRVSGTLYILGRSLSDNITFNGNKFDEAYQKAQGGNGGNSWVDFDPSYENGWRIRFSAS